MLVTVASELQMVIVMSALRIGVINSETEYRHTLESCRDPAEPKHYAAMAEHPPDRKASEKFHRPAYQAGKLIETQGQQLWHGDVTGYIARKYKIGSDTIGDNDKGKTGSIPE